MRHFRHSLIKVALLMLIASAFPLRQLHSQTLQIDSATADWIEGFVHFVRWNDEERAKGITIGILDAPEVANYLERRLAANPTATPIKVRRLDSHLELDDIDILYVGIGNRSHWKTITSACTGSGILSISEQDGFIDSGGCIEFSIRKNRMAFFANTLALKESNIEIKAQLLELALDSSQ